MGILKQTGASLMFALLLAGTSSCERKQCEDAVCPVDQDLKLSLVNDQNTNLIVSGQIQKADVLFYSPVKGDTLKNTFDTKNGSMLSPMIRDQGLYTIIIGQSTNIDLLVYQAYVPSEFECCSGYWRIDSVFARGEKLPMNAEKDAFLLKVQ